MESGHKTAGSFLFECWSRHSFNGPLARGSVSSKESLQSIDARENSARRRIRTPSLWSPFLTRGVCRHHANCDPLQESQCSRCRCVPYPLFFKRRKVESPCVPSMCVCLMSRSSSYEFITLNCHVCLSSSLDNPAKNNNFVHSHVIFVASLHRFNICPKALSNLID